MLPIAIEKPILEYEDSELQDLNLKIESDVLTKPQVEIDVIEEDKTPSKTVILYYSCFNFLDLL